MMTTETTTTRRTIRAVVHYELSEQGRREALLQGLSPTAGQTVEADVDLATYLPLVRVDDNGVARLALGSTWGEKFDAPQTWETLGQPRLSAALAEVEAAAAAEAAIEPTSAAFIADTTARQDSTDYVRGRTRAVWRGVALDDAASDEAARRLRADQEAAEDCRIAAFLADPAARAHIWIDDIVLDEEGLGIEYGTNGKLVLVRKVHPRYEEIRAEVARRSAADRAAAENVQRQRRVAKLTYLRDWIHQHGTDHMRERQAAGRPKDDDAQEVRDRVEHIGLVPEREVIDAIRDMTFAALSGEAIYRQIRASDLDEADEFDDEAEDGLYRHRDKDMRCESSAESEATPAQWARLKGLRAKAPAGATVTLRCHECECTAQGCPESHSVTRYGILVTVTVTEGLDLHREYAC
jgi:hypothetical protein